MELHLNVENGNIRDARIFGDFFNHKDIGELESALSNVPHEESAIKKALGKYEIGDYIRNVRLEEMIAAFF